MNVCVQLNCYSSAMLRPYKALGILAAFFFLVVLILLCVVLLWPTGWNQEEYAVYNAVIEKYCDQLDKRVDLDPDWRLDTVVIEEETDAIGMHHRVIYSDSSLLQLAQKVRLSLHLWKKANLDFAIKNWKSYRLTNSFRLSKQYVLLSPDEAKNFVRRAERYHEMYPNSCGPLVVSRVGFSWGKDQAIVYVDHAPDFLGGEGYYVLLLKQDGVWVIHRKDVVWIS